MSIVLTVVIVALCLSVFDRKNADLQKAPGYNLIYPDGRLLKTQPIRSVFGAGASIERVYGVNTSAQLIRAYFHQRLIGLGYKQSDKKGDQYTGEHYVFQLSSDPPNARVYGRYYTSAGYRAILYVKLSN